MIVRLRGRQPGFLANTHDRSPTVYPVVDLCEPSVPQHVPELRSRPALAGCGMHEEHQVLRSRQRTRLVLADVHVVFHHVTTWRQRCERGREQRPHARLVPVMQNVREEVHIDPARQRPTEHVSVRTSPRCPITALGQQRRRRPPPRSETGRRSRSRRCRSYRRRPRPAAGARPRVPRTSPAGKYRPQASIAAVIRSAKTRSDNRLDQSSPPTALDQLDGSPVRSTCSSSAHPGRSVNEA